MTSNASINQGKLMPASGRGNSLELALEVSELRYRRLFENAALRALKNGRTGFRTWDALERKTAANQIDTLSRWNKGEQTA